MLYFLRGTPYIIPTAITFIVVLLFAFAYHELAHAVVADRLGDSTPRSFGRMTLNPFAHLDRTGFIFALLVGFGFAYTPINPNRLKGDPRISHMIVSVAGPLANLLMAIIFAVPLRWRLVELYVPPGSFLPSPFFFLNFGVTYNLLLMAFNLLPIPPLDGFNILSGLLPADMSYRLQAIRPYGMRIFIVVVFLLPFVGIDVISLVISPVIGFLRPLLTGL